MRKPAMQAGLNDTLDRNGDRKVLTFDCVGDSVTRMVQHVVGKRAVAAPSLAINFHSPFRGSTQARHSS